MDILIKYQINDREIKYKKLSEENVGEILFKCNEYNKLIVSFESDKTTVKNIKIQTFSEPDLINYEEGKILIVNPSNEENSLVPGLYEICVNNKYSFYFEIESNIEGIKLNFLIEYLNKYSKGIEYNYNLIRKSPYFNENNYINIDEWNEISYYLLNILEKPSYDLIKIYEYKNCLKKFDARVLRHNILHSNEKNLFYQPRVKENYHISDNFLLLHSLEAYINNILLLRKNMNIVYSNRKKFILNQKKELEKCESKLKEIKNNNYISENYKKYLEKRINFLKNYITKQETINIISCFDKILTTAEKYLDDFRKKFEIDFYFNIPYKSFPKNFRYKKVIELLNEGINKANHLKERKLQKSFALQKSDKLFEYFCLFRVIHVLNNLEFTIENYNLLFKYEILPATEIILKKENIKIKILYDNEAFKRGNITDNYEGMVSLNSIHNRPDITFMLYKDNIFKKTIIFEVKYRKFKYIYNPKGETDVKVTMTDYYSLAYQNINKVKPNKDAVESVVLLYPSQANYNKYFSEEEIYHYIPINVEETSPEESLEEIIIDFIEKYTEI